MQYVAREESCACCRDARNEVEEGVEEEEEEEDGEEEEEEAALLFLRPEKEVDLVGVVPVVGSPSPCCFLFNNLCNILRAIARQRSMSLGAHNPVDAWNVDCCSSS